LSDSSEHDLPLPLDVTAALVGEYRWIETALYEMLGSWVADMPVAAVQVHLDAQSLRHAWHAELWGDRLPVMAGADPDGLTVPSPATSALFAALDGRPGALPLIAGLYRVVLPRLVTSYERHLQATSPFTDGPVERALRLVLNDEITDWRAGEAMVQRLMARPHDVAAVHEFLQGLETAVVAEGPRSGLLSFPPSVPEGRSGV
jgi:hypothetical protein